MKCRLVVFVSHDDNIGRLEDVHVHVHASSSSIHISNDDNSDIQHAPTDHWPLGNPIQYLCVHPQAPNSVVLF